MHFKWLNTWKLELKRVNSDMINRADSRLHPHIFAVATPFLFFPFVSLNKDPCALRDRCSCAVSGFLKHSSLKPLH